MLSNHMPLPITISSKSISPPPFSANRIKTPSVGRKGDHKSTNQYFFKTPEEIDIRGIEENVCSDDGIPGLSGLPRPVASTPVSSAHATTASPGKYSRLTHVLIVAVAISRRSPNSFCVRSPYASSIRRRTGFPTDPWICSYKARLETFDLPISKFEFSNLLIINQRRLAPVSRAHLTALPGTQFR